MLTTKRKQIHEKIVEKEGVLYRVVFSLEIQNGAVAPKILNIVKLGNISDLEKKEENLLPVFVEKNIRAETKKEFNFENLLFSEENKIFSNGSKPRAPTF